MVIDIYDFLEYKATSKRHKYNQIYCEIEKNLTYNYTGVLQLVDKYIDRFRFLDLKNKTKYLIADNSVDSVAIFIALLRCGAKPVLINKNEFDFDKDKSNIINYQEPLKSFDYNPNDFNRDYIIANNNSFAMNGKEEMQLIESFIEKVEVPNNNDFDFYLFTSGTTGHEGKLIPMKQKDLILASLMDKNSSSVLTSVSIASISGLIFGVIKPIIHDTKNYMLHGEWLINSTNALLKLASCYKINRLFLPRNILDLIDDNIKNLDLSNIDTIYLSGEINSIEVINKLREYFPTLKENVFVNLYGRTENYGVISACREEYLHPVYINVFKSNRNELYLSFDKKKVYRLYMKNGKLIKGRTNLVYDDITYVSYLPVSENKLENVSVESNSVIGKIIVKNDKTDDYGIYINNQLYFIGRKEDFVNINNSEYILSAIEQFFSSVTTLKTSAISHNNKIYLIISYKLDNKKTNNYQEMLKLSKKCNELIDQLGLPFEYPIFVSSDNFPKNKLLRKARKSKMYNLINECDFGDYSYEELFVKKIKDIIKLVYNKEINVSLNNNLFKFKKEEISIDELLDLQEKYLGYISFNEDDDNYYFIVDDCILFNVYSYYNSLNKLSKDDIALIKKDYYSMNKKEFITKFNNFFCREVGYRNIKICLNIKKNKDSITFKPYQLVAKNNYDETNKIVVKKGVDSDNAVNHSEIIELDEASCGVYEEEEFISKINKFRKILNNEYKIDNESNCLLNGQKKTDIISKFLLKKYSIKMVIVDSDSYSSNEDALNSIIVTDNPSEYINLNNNYLKCQYSSFNMDGFKMRDDLSYDNYINNLVSQIILKHSENDNKDFGIIIESTDGEMLLSKNRDMELVNLEKKEKMESIVRIVEEIRKRGIVELIKDGKKTEINLSNAKLIIPCNKAALFDLEYALHIIDDYNIIIMDEDMKVIKKVKK